MKNLLNEFSSSSIFYHFDRFYGGKPNLGQTSKSKQQSIRMNNNNIVDAPTQRQTKYETKDENERKC